MAKSISQQVLDDFMATLATNPNVDRKQLMQAFPEFENNEELLNSAYDYRETRMQNPMADIHTVNQRFPEFFGEEDQVSQEQPENSATSSEKPRLSLSQIPGGGNAFMPLAGIANRESEQRIAEREAQMQREEAAQLPITDRDRELQEQIRQKQIEGTWGKPNGVMFSVDKTTGMPVITQTEGAGVRLYDGSQLANQDEIDAQKGQLPTYMTREIKTPEDLLVNTAEAWSANTETGRDFKGMLDEGLITPEDYKQAMIEANQDYINQQTRILGQKATNETVKEISQHISPYLEKARQQALGSMRDPYTASAMYHQQVADEKAGATAAKEQNPDYPLYLAAQQYLVDAVKISEAAQKGEGFWKGLGKSAGDVDTWDFGLSQLSRSMQLKKIVEKYEQDPNSLTDGEASLMNAAVAYMSACAYNSDRLSRMYKAGQTTGESIPFMLQFAVMPVGAIKDKVAKGILGYGIEQFGGKALQTAGKYTFGRAAAETGTALLGNMAAAGVQTAAFGAPKIAGGTISRMTGDIKPEFDESGRIVYGGRENQQGLGEALWNAGVDTYVENLSEMILTSGDPIKAWLGGTNLFKNLSKNEAIQVLTKMGEKWEQSAMGKMAGRMQFRSFPEEVKEEYVGNLMRWGLSTDVNSAEEAGLDIDGQIDLWMGLAPTSIAFAGLGLGEYSVRGGIDRFQSSQAARRLRKIMLEGEERKYLDNLLKSQDSDEFKFAAHDVVKSILRNNQLSAQEKRAYLDNLYVTYQSQLALEAEDAKIADEVKTEVQGITNKNNGYVYPVSLAGDPSAQGYIVGGYVEVDETDPSKLRIGNDEVVTVRLDDGRVVQLSTNELDLTGTPQMAQEVFNTRAEERINAQRAADKAKSAFHEGDEGTIQVPNPQTGEVDELASKILSVTDEGVQVEIIDPAGQSSIALIPNEEALRSLRVVTLEQMQPAQPQAQETPAEQPQEQPTPTPLPENLVIFSNGTDEKRTIDNGDGTYTLMERGENGEGIPFRQSEEWFANNGYAKIEQEQPETQTLNQGASQTDGFGQGQNDGLTQIVPNIYTASADDYVRATVENKYKGNKAKAQANIAAQLNGAKSELQEAQREFEKFKNKGITSKMNSDQWDEQYDKYEQQIKGLTALVSKLEAANIAAAHYKTQAELQEEAERKAREAALREQRRQLAEAEAAGDIEAKWQNTKKTIGFAATKTLPNGQKVNGHYILTEAGDVVPSHDPRKNYADSEGYVMENGQNVNDNNYKDPEVQKIANDIAQNYGGQAVEQMPFLENKAGRVLSGNNRTISGIIAAENNTDQAYLAALAENAQQFGFTPEQLAEYQHPRLQYVVEDELPFTTGTFAMFNQQEKKTKSSVNRAVANSKMVTEAVRDRLLEIMDQYDSLDSFFSSSNAASAITQTLINEGLMTKQEVAEKMDDSGIFNQTGKEYVTDMLLGTLFDEQTIRMLAGEKTLKQAILRALPSIVENRRLKGYELTENINKAISLLYEARKANKGKSTAEAFQLYLRQVDAFKGKVKDNFSEFEIILAGEMANGVERTRDLLNMYNNSAENEANGQDSLFDKRTPEDIKQQVYEHYAKQQPELTAAINGAAVEGAESQSSVPSSTEELGEVRQVISPEQLAALQQQAQEFSDKLGVPIVVFDSIDEVPDAEKAAKELYKKEGNNVDAWMSADGKTIYVNANSPEIQKEGGLQRKVFHEVVAHKGLRQLMGRNFDQLCVFTWEAMPVDQRAKYYDYAKQNYPGRSEDEWRLIAADEYMAFNAEQFTSLDANDQSEAANIVRTTWNKIANKLRELLDKILGSSYMTDDFLADLYKISYNNLRGKVVKDAISFKDKEEERYFDNISRSLVQDGMRPELAPIEALATIRLYAERGKLQGDAKAAVKEIDAAIKATEAIVGNPDVTPEEIAKCWKDAMALYDKYPNKQEEKATEIEKVIADFKKQYPDPNVAILFRNGKTYDIYGEDAVKAAEILGVEPTEKDGMPFVSFPTEDVGTNMRKFIAKGVKVGIASHPAHKPSKGDYQQGDKFTWEGKEAIIKSFTHFGTAIVEVDGSRRELSREQLDDILDYGDYMYHVGEVVTYNGKRAQIVEFASGDPVIQVEGESEKRYVSFSDIERIKKGQEQTKRQGRDAADTEIGGALVDRLEDMGVSVSTDLQANRDALKAAKADKSEAGAIHYYKTPSGQQYGFSYKGKVYLNPTKINAELPLHEYGHLWAEALRRLNPENWQHVVDTIKADTDAWEFVKSLRPELTDENEIAEEVIATFSGKKGAERLKAEYDRMHGKDADYKSKWGNIFKNISKAIQDFWKAVGDFLNIKYESAEQVYDQVLKDFVENMNPWKRVSDFLRQRDAEYVQAAESGDIKTATNIFYEALKENIGNGITPYMSVGTYNNLKRLAKGVKTRDEALIKEAADLIAPLIPDNAVLIPAPSHSGTATDMLDLTNAIAEVTGSEVADVLRSAPRESQYQAKKTTDVPMASKQLGIAVEGEIPADKTPIIIDNVVDSGNTAEACVQAVGKGVVVTLADSAEQYGHAASLKSAAPVLRDKDGKVIPLSKRFDLSGSRYLGRRMYLRPDDLRLSVSGTQTIPVGKNTLVGLHNISAEKLRKALKMGGLANPSTAVIDIARQNHEQYGDISLIMPSLLVDSKTGRNAGTFTGDIWSPTYPSVERIMSDKGDEAYYQAITKAFGDNEARRPVLSRAKLDFDDYLDSGNVRAGLAYWYLLEKGIEPGDVYFNSGISDEIKRRFEPLMENGLMNMTAEERSTLLSLIAEREGKTADDLLQEAQTTKKRYEDTIADPNAKQFYKTIAQRTIEEIDTYGVRYNVLSDGYHAIERAVRDDGKIDLTSTLIAAQDIVQTQHQADFDKWLSDMDKRFDIKEVLFEDYDRDGNRIYKPHTLANASRMMNKEDLQNAGDHAGLGATRGQLVERMETLADIRAEKGRLRPGAEEDFEPEEWNKMQDEWFNKVLNPLSEMQKISDNPFSQVGYAETRLQEALRTKDPIATLNKEYGYKIDPKGEWAKNLKDLVQRIKSLPTKYFETKFRRPVYLNEFANAVVPNDLPQELRDGLEKAGLTLFEYDPKEEGSRRATTLQATDGEGIRFSVSGGLSTDRTLTKAAREDMQQIKDAALADGTFMQAPNGKRSNLNERQWLQVRLRSFKRWFGDWENDPENASKVLDENGEPMVVYHGTGAKFNSFERNSQGLHFGTIAAAQQRLAEISLERDKAIKSRIISAFLNIKNPDTAEDQDAHWNFDVKYAKINGYDGLTYTNKWEDRGSTSYIAFEPNQIKSATHNDGSFSEENDDIRFSISNQNNDIFYSNAERAVESIKQEKATPAQWLAMIEKAGGLKAGEDKWIGLSDWLKAQHATVEMQPGETRSQYIVRLGEASKKFTISKQDILDYIRQNKIQIEEVEYGEYDMQDALEGYRREYKQYYDEAVADNAEDPQEVAWQRMIDEHGDDFDMGFYAYGDELQWDADSDYVKWELENSGESDLRPIDDTRMRYTTHGLQNKREIALTVPTIESWNESDEIHFGDAGEGRAIAWIRFGDTEHTSSPDGIQQPEDVLVIDEIQSNRHQQGREKGYVDSKTAIEYRQLEKETFKAQLEYHDYRDQLWKKYENQVRTRGEMLDVLTPEEKSKDTELQEKYENLYDRWEEFKNNMPATTGVPEAPFEKNWHELAMKRILRFAAENGYDKVAWTTGEQQAKRYDIGKEIDHIVKTDKNTYEVYPTSGLMMTLEFDENGMYADEYDREYNGKSMSDIFGKDLAKRLKEMPVDETLQGDGLRVGYDGMKGFYDDILPRFMQKYGKKWGVQVGEVTMPQLEEGYQTMHAIDINDAMRESVLEGQPMFSITGSRDRLLNDEEKKAAREKLNNTKPIDAAVGVIKADGETSARKAAEKWADEHLKEPLTFEKEVGTVVIDKTSVKNSLAHGYNQAKLDAIPTLPEGFGGATYLGSMDEIDGSERNKTVNHYFAYPINYNGDLCYVFCRAKADANTNRLYVHEVFIADKMKSNALQTAAGNNSEPHRGIALYREILSDVLFDRKGTTNISDMQIFDGKTIEKMQNESKMAYAERISEEIKRENPKDTSLDDAIRFSITVNHNSPYLLKRADGAFVDPETGERLGFDLRFIGKGEGGQAHGYGSYFSKNDIRSYGEGYGFSLRDIKDAFNTSRWQSFGVGDAFDVAKGYLLEAHSEKAPSLRKWLEDRLAQKQELLKSYEGKVANTAEEDLMVFRAEADVQYIPALLRDMVNDIDTRNRHHYTVDIPDNTGENYLEEDQPLTREQIDRLRKAAKETGIPKFLETISGFLRFAETNPEEYPFRKFYSDITDFQYGYPRETISNFLKDAGFVGIHYDGRRDGECYVIFNPDDAVITDHIRFSVTGGENDKKGIANEDDQIRFSVVTSRKKIAELEAGEKIKVYRAAQVIDGKLYPPMAAKQQGQLVKPIELGRWEQAEEHPELAKDGKFKLDKANGSSVVPAAYNPYFHTSRSPLNDQFSSAYDRPNLVTLEVEVPASELTSGYKAEGAKDAVGETSWHSGAVSGKLAKAGEPRKVILSRWDKPLRIVPDAEVAEKIAGMLAGKDIAIPYNVVTPSLRAELEKQGVTISDTPSGTVRKPKEEIRFSVTNPSTLSWSETKTKALVQQANNNYNIMQSALKKVTADLKGIRAAMRMQSDYDRKVVDSLLNLYNTLLQENGVWAQYMPDTTRRIATQIVHAIGKQNITEEVNTIMDHMVHAQAKAAQRQWDKLRQTPIDKINISGVVMQGKVALEGQHALKAMNDALQANMTIEQIEEQINQLMDMEDNATDESLKTQYKGQWIGLTIAAQHLERLQHLQEERKQLDLELQSARSNKALKPAARQQLVDNIKQAMRDNYIEQAEAYTRSTQDLSEYVNTQEGRAKDFIRRQDANRDKIRSYAQRDLRGISTDNNRDESKVNIVRSILDAVASPIRDLQSLLRLCGRHAPDGEGYLYNHFMRNWMDAADTERLGIVAASKTLDAKIAELTHGKYKTWEEAARKINDASHNMFTVTTLNGIDGEDMPYSKEMKLSAGNALYIYAVNKMNDGRMKLNGMNITEEDVKALVDAVREKFGQEILDVVDWIQSEFFSQLRDRYNPTHIDLFGAPMDAIENYFPLRLSAAARKKNVDLGDPDTDVSMLLSGSTTGAIKRRTKNSIPIDLHADFFKEVIRHVAQMERWNAFAQWTRDANILFSDTNFRERVKNMDSSIYGKGDALYNYMRDAFKVANGTYRQTGGNLQKGISDVTLNIAKGVTSAKINFRVWTAMKQIASFPAFFTYMQDGTFVKSYMHNWGHWSETMEWAKENLPNFEKRVSKRDLGDFALMRRSTDWKITQRIMDMSTKYGMAANVFFDTLTCATGARAVYESHLAEYMKKGYSEEDARNRARQDAEQAFNTSQQSSEGAFMAPVQADRNIITSALTVFRTSPIQYTRNFFYHTRGIARKLQPGAKEKMIAFRMDQYKNDGLNDEQARKAAEMDFDKSMRQDIVGFVVYGAVLNILWRLAGNFLYYLFGDDDDKKKELLLDAVTGGAFVSPITGLLGGGNIESYLDDHGSISSILAPELPLTQDVKKAEQYLNNNKYAEFASQALSIIIQSSTGFDPQTAADAITRVVVALDSEQELDAAQKSMFVLNAMLSIPQSQYEQMLIDKVVSGETAKATALEDYIRYYKVHTAPLTFLLRGEESDEKAEENAKKRFNKLLTERGKLHNPEDYEE